MIKLNDHEVKNNQKKEFIYFFRTVLNGAIKLYDIKGWNCFVISRNAFGKDNLVPKYFATRNERSKLIAISDEVPEHLWAIWFEHEIECGEENNYQPCSFLFSQEIKNAVNNLNKEEFSEYINYRLTMLKDTSKLFPHHPAIEKIKKAVELFSNPEIAIALAR